MRELRNILEKIRERKDFNPDEIPNINLYMDQVLNLFESEFPYNVDEAKLTKMMINNYAKNGLIKPANKKKYGKSHMFDLLITCLLKRNLSMNQIKTAITNFYLEGQNTSENIYRRFLEDKNSSDPIVNECIEEIISLMESAEPKDDVNKLRKILMLSYYSNLFAEAARCMLSE